LGCREGADGQRRLAQPAAFRYSGGVGRLRGSRLSLVGVDVGLIAVVWGAVLAACERGGKTPEDAYQRLADAVAARDGGRLFDALDLETRWSWMSVQRAHREAYDIVLSNFPEGPERERVLRRFEPGARSDSARDLFAGTLDPAVWDALAAALAATGRVPHLVVEGAQATAGARPLTFRQGPGGHRGWGYAGLAPEAEQVKRRALTDLDLMRTSAADYERAAARQSR
jgi:hypothetical protein